MPRILDPDFEYTPSYATDIRKTFEQARAQSYRRLTCGCCTNGCACNHHCDIPRGRKPGPRCERCHASKAFQEPGLTIWPASPTSSILA